MYVYIYIERDREIRDEWFVSPAMEGCSSQMLKQETKEKEKRVRVCLLYSLSGRMSFSR